ncbi:MAG: hypothetical protein K0U86_15500 [Planctomycetes bacterium]|nr:hypothetical protein [Planctomycetota bacterium]MCH9726305.1 hypothetical protein [Planctomycetota bacterium]MCH9776417.1 hypothetical protein [Planctomycetota bacterium]
MYHSLKQSALTAFICSCFLYVPGNQTMAQNQSLNRGFSIRADIAATGEERAAQKSLWVLDAVFKPMRMVRMDLTNLKTGKKEKTLVWYIVYKCVLRPIERPDDKNEFTPENAKVPPLGPPLFVPEITLITNDNGQQKIYPNQILPEAEAIINKRERAQFKNAVEIIGELPEETPTGSKKENAIFGVCVWTGVDPNTDYFTLLFSGLSNGYKNVPGSDGKTITLRKVLVQQYWRPGDEFGQQEQEFRPKGSPYWVYLPDDPQMAAKMKKELKIEESATAKP